VTKEQIESDISKTVAIYLKHREHGTEIPGEILDKMDHYRELLNTAEWKL